MLTHQRVQQRMLSFIASCRLRLNRTSAQRSHGWQMTGGQYVAVFWTGLSANRTVTVPLSAVRGSGQGAKVRELWGGADLPPVADRGLSKCDAAR